MTLPGSFSPDSFSASANPDELIIPQPMPSLNHSYLCLKILESLLQNETILPLPELTLGIANGLTPDISVFLKQTIQPNFFEDVARFPERPILAIEVISASQTIQEMLQKAKLLVKEGVETVWTVEPFSQTIFVTRADGERRFHAEMVRSGNIEVDFGMIFASK